MATIKQRKAVEKVIENHGNVSRAMIDVGYSEKTAVNPSNLTNSKGWQELMEKHLADDKLAKVHDEGLKAFNKDGADYAVRHKYLDTAYKLKGSYAPEKSVQVQVKGDVKDYAKYSAVKERFEEELLEKLQDD